MPPCASGRTLAVPLPSRPMEPFPRRSRSSAREELVAPPFPLWNWMRSIRRTFLPTLCCSGCLDLTGVRYPLRPQETSLRCRGQSLTAHSLTTACADSIFSSKNGILYKTLTRDRSVSNIKNGEMKSWKINTPQFKEIFPISNPDPSHVFYISEITEDFTVPPQPIEHPLTLTETPLQKRRVFTLSFVPGRCVTDFLSSNAAMTLPSPSLSSDPLPTSRLWRGRS